MAIHKFDLKTDMQSVLHNVMGLSALWQQRGDHPFYTLGASAYLDIEREDKSNYYMQMSLTNRPIQYCFSALLGEIADVIQGHFKIPTIFDADLALPGFHIFFSHEEFVKEGGLWHMDMGHIQLGLPDVEPISYTATITLPQDGGGLNYKVDGEEKYLPYKVGQMVLHDGCMMHQIAPLKSYNEGDMRITLQGHGVKDKDQYLLFW